MQNDLPLQLDDPNPNPKSQTATFWTVPQRSDVIAIWMNARKTRTYKLMKLALESIMTNPDAKKMLYTRMLSCFDPQKGAEYREKVKLNLPKGPTHTLDPQGNRIPTRPAGVEEIFSSSVHAKERKTKNLRLIHAGKNILYAEVFLPVAQQ